MKSVLFSLCGLMMISQGVLAQPKGQWPFPSEKRNPRGSLASVIGSCQAADAAAVVYPAHTYNKDAPYKAATMSLLSTTNAELGVEMQMTDAKGKNFTMLIMMPPAVSSGNVSEFEYQAPDRFDHLDTARAVVTNAADNKSSTLELTIKTNEGKTATTKYSCKYIL